MGLNDSSPAILVGRPLRRRPGYVPAWRLPMAGTDLLDRHGFSRAVDGPSSVWQLPPSDHCPTRIPMALHPSSTRIEASV
jgi:hypothetical protein